MIYRAWKNWRRTKIRQRPFPQAWLETIELRVPYCQLLPENDQRELLGHIQVFLAEKSFEGCGGVTVTDEMRVVIAAQACILLLHRSSNYFPQLGSIYIYPHPYVAETHRQLPGGIIEDGIEARVGESWRYGNVILTWDSVLAGARDIHDGHNVVLHEFAHQLDEEGGAANGAPHLELKSQYIAWARVLSAEFLQLNRDVHNGHKTVMDEYGATNPAEFFAVATETFFEKPIQLRKKHLALYDELKLFYQQDPAAFHEI